MNATPRFDPEAAFIQEERSLGLMMGRVGLGLTGLSMLLCLVIPPGEPASAFVLLEGSTLLVLVGLLVLLGRAAPGSVQSVVSAMGLAVVARAVCFVHLAEDPVHTAILLVTMVGACYMVLRPRTAGVLVALACAGWLLVAQSHPAQEAVVWGIDLGFTAALGLTVNWHHTRGVRAEKEWAADAVEAGARVSRQASELEQKAEELLVARDVAMEALRLRDEFLANVSHELRTPMNGIVGMTELLSGTSLSKEQQGYAHQVQASAEVLRSTIDDILDLSRLEAGTMGLEKAELDPGALLDEVREVVAREAEDKGLSLATSIGPDVPASVQADPVRVRQVLLGLAGNAVKFTDAGEVTLRAVMSAGRVLRFEVTDTGIGISPEQQRKAFEPFCQIDGSSTRRHGGVGIGLAICRHLVRLMGGRMGLESEPGRGSTFSFSLPCGGLARSLHAVGARGRALVALSSHVAGTVLARMLQRLGYQTEQRTAEVTAADREAYDVVVMDGGPAASDPAS